MSRNYRSLEPVLCNEGRHRHVKPPGSEPDGAQRQSQWPTSNCVSSDTQVPSPGRGLLSCETGATAWPRPISANNWIKTGRFYNENVVRKTTDDVHQRGDK